MGAMPNEPSMEEILSSIKRIIADEDRATPRAPRRTGNRIVSLDDDDGDEILELTEELTDESDSQEDEDVTEMPAVRAKSAKPAKSPRARESATADSGAAEAATVLSDISARAARDSLEISRRCSCAATTAHPIRLKDWCARCCARCSRTGWTESACHRRGDGQARDRPDHRPSMIAGRIRLAFPDPFALFGRRSNVEGLFFSNRKTVLRQAQHERCGGSHIVLDLPRCPSRLKARA